MSFTQLRAFHFVATAGGYSQASREMSISQSTLSAQVRQLEAASGLAFFERTPRGVTLTADGESLYKVTSRLFSALEEAESFLKAPRTGTGRLRVTADGVQHSLPILMRLRQRRPDLVFSLSVQNSDTVTDQLLQYRADVGITAQPSRDERLYVQPLMQMRIGVFVPRTHAWAQRESVVMRDIEGCPFVLRERGSRTRTIFEQNIAAHRVTLGPVLEVASREGVREAVATGFGVGAVADIEFGFDSRLRYLPIRDAEIAIDEYVICLEERRRQPMIADFFRCAREAFSQRAASSLPGPGPAQLEEVQ